MSELPEELAHALEQPHVANTVLRILKGAELLAVHPTKGLLMVWYGGQGWNVYDPGQWGNGDTGEVYHFNTADPSQVEDAHADAVEKAEEYGFEVVA